MPRPSRAVTQAQLHQLARHGAITRISELEAEIAFVRAALRGLGEAPAGESAPTRRKRRRRGKLSAAGRKAIAEAQRERWAALKAKSNSKSPARPKRRRKPMSAAARKALGARMKKYWATRRKAKAAATK